MFPWAWAGLTSGEFIGCNTEGLWPVQNDSLQWFPVVDFLGLANVE